MLRWFKERRETKRIAHELYGSIVTHARMPALYTDCGVPDTLEGRFEMLVAHMFLVLERMKSEGEAVKPLGRAVVETFFADMDGSMRELGVGDLTVPKKIRKAADGFYGRLTAYAEAVAAGDERGLAAALARNVWSSEAPAGSDDRALARYMLAAHRQLADTDWSEIAAGRLGLPGPTSSDNGGRAGEA
ncbi:MAG: ubiquinol-cytochrome C chaperone [Hyphomicrobiaceae bacterium]|nr:ubiquinol-cytochrome C chaperone [Hyphomicrobiaceae bacterium]